MATDSKKQLGVRGEDLACAELERQGMRVLERNWRCRLGEIDIVAAETGEEAVTLVFCEVKCRAGLGFGHPLEAITFAKMRSRDRAKCPPAMASSAPYAPTWHSTTT